MNSKSAELTRGFLALLETAELPSLGPKPRASRKDLTTLRSELEGLFASQRVSSETQQLVRSLVFLWHDYLNESHSISQDIPSRDGSFVHAIMHRREPDYWNSKYWFNRVGSHPTFPRIAEEVGASSDGLACKLVVGGKWNPNSFVDLCEEFADRPGSTEYKVLQQIQQIEIKVLLQYFLSELQG